MNLYYPIQQKMFKSRASPYGVEANTFSKARLSLRSSYSKKEITVVIKPIQKHMQVHHYEMFYSTIQSKNMTKKQT